MRGIVFDMQHYAIYDGPGIRTTVFLKGCPLRCTWCQNPESQKRVPEISYFRERCEQCGRCVEACPANALRLTEEGVERDVALCRVCGTCVETCPQGARERIGREMAVEEVVDAVAGDKPFYDNSGGGVTLSGGEPTVQIDFLIELLRALKGEGIHTALETCGFFREKLIDPLARLVDLFLFDLKHIDSETHERFTGVPNDRVLANFTEVLARAGSPRIIPRIPVIPSFNTEPDAIDAIVTFLQQVGYSGPIHLMPYNKLARTKYEKVGMGSSYTDMGDLSRSQLDAIIDQLENRSFAVVCNH